MIFLMNDAVLDVDMRALGAPGAAGRFRHLSLPFVLQLGRELYADEPLLHRRQPERAARLAALVVSVSPEVNAALFEAPERGCAPARVQARLAEVAFDVLAALRAGQAVQPLTPAAVDREVWRRLAA